MAKGQLKKCPSCGKLFTCNADSDCWCESVNIHKKDFLLLNQKFTDCICPECLMQYAENPL